MDACTIVYTLVPRSVVPTIQAKLRETDLEPKAVLLLHVHNCSAHSNEEELVSANEQVVGKVLPPNVTSLIQPVDQVVLVSCNQYRREILEELVLHNNAGIIDFHKGINILRVVQMVAAAWDENTLRLSWRKMLPIEDTVDDAGDDQGESQGPLDDDPSAAHFQSYFQMLEQDLDESEIAK